MNRKITFSVILFIIVLGWADHATTNPCDDDWYGITLLTKGAGLDLNLNSLLTTVGQALDDFITLKSGSSGWVF